MNRRILAVLLACLIAAPIPASAGQIYVPATIESLTVAGQTIGDLIYADSTSSFTRLADVATGNALISGGVGAAPSWGKVGLTTHVSGTLAYGSGGTGATSYATANCLVRAQASAFDCSTLVYDGTNVTLNSGQLILTENGTNIVLKGSTGRGIFMNGTVYGVSDGTPMIAWSFGNGAQIFRAAAPLSWAPSTDPTATPDLSIYRTSAGRAQITNGTQGTFRDLDLRTSYWNGASGETASCTNATTTVNAVNLAATITATSLIPAGSVVSSVVTRVTTGFNGTLTSHTIGDGTTANLFGNNVAITANTTSDLTNHLATFKPTLYTAATNVVMTAVAGTYGATGTIRVTVFYCTATAPTS